MGTSYAAIDDAQPQVAFGGPDVPGRRSTVDHAGGGTAVRRARVFLAIDGMWCAACALAIEQAATAVPGVLVRSISVAARSAVIELDPQQAQLPDVLAAIEAIGYRAVSASDQSQRAHANEAERRGL